MLTENRCKSAGFINGQIGTVKYFLRNSIFVELPDNAIIAVYPILKSYRSIIYPLQPFYCSTIFKEYKD